MLRRIERSTEEFCALIGLSSGGIEQPFVANMRLAAGDFVLIPLYCVRDGLKTSRDCRDRILLHSGRIARCGSGEELLCGCFNAGTRCGIKIRVLRRITLLCTPQWGRNQCTEEKSHNQP